jgi:membrane protease YdiL (CAAX protease family)
MAEIRRRCFEFLSWAAIAVELALFLCAWSLVERYLGALDGWDNSLFGIDGYWANTIFTPAWLVSFVVAFGLFFPGLRRVFGAWKPGDFGCRCVRGQGGLGLFLTLVAMLIANVGMLAIPGVADQAWRSYGVQNRTDLVVFIMVVVPISAALGEELLFRSYVQGSLSRLHVSWGPLAAAVAFVISHRFQGLIPILGLHLPLALLFAAVYRRTGSLVPVFFAHLLFDVMVFGELYILSAQPSATMLLAAGLSAACTVGLWLLRAHGRTAFSELWHMLTGLRTGGLFHFALAVGFVIGFTFGRDYLIGLRAIRNQTLWHWVAVGGGLAVLVAKRRLVAAKDASLRVSRPAIS